MIESITGLPWSEIWMLLSPLIGVGVGSLVSYNATQRQVDTNVQLAREAREHDEKRSVENRDHEIRLIKEGRDYELKLIRDKLEFEKRSAWRSIQFAVFQDIQKNLWKAAIQAAQARDRAARAVEAAERDDGPAYRTARQEMAEWQSRGIDTLHLLETSIAMLDSRDLREPLDAVHALCARMFDSFFQPESFQSAFEEFEMAYQSFRASVAENGRSIIMGTKGHL